MRLSYNPMFLASLVACMAAGFSPAAQSATFDCRTFINGVLLYASGAVNVLRADRGDWTYVCNLNEPYKGVSTVTCAMWASTLLQAKRDGKRADFYFSYASNPDGSTPTCANTPHYGSAPAPVYIGLVENTPPAKATSEDQPVADPDLRPSDAKTPAGDG